MSPSKAIRLVDTPSPHHRQTEIIKKKKESGDVAMVRCPLIRAKPEEEERIIVGPRNSLPFRSLFLVGPTVNNSFFFLPFLSRARRPKGEEKRRKRKRKRPYDSRDLWAHGRFLPLLSSTPCRSRARRDRKREGHKKPTKENPDWGSGFLCLSFSSSFLFF